jgi:hypothetical protein
MLAGGWGGRVNIFGKRVDGRDVGGQNGQHDKKPWITPNQLHGPESCFRKAQAGSLSRYLYQLRALLSGGPIMAEQVTPEEVPHTDIEAMQPSVDVLRILAKARAKQRREKPSLEAGQIWITLTDFMDEEEEAALMKTVDVATLNNIAAEQDRREADLILDTTQEPQLQLSKAKGELIPLVRFLKGCTFREKLAGVAMDLLGYSDISEALDPREGNVYDGNIGQDLQNDWEDEIFAAVEKEIGTPEERVLAAYLAGLSNAR